MIMGFMGWLGVDGLVPVPIFWGGNVIVEIDKRTKVPI